METSVQQPLYVKMVLSAWDTQNMRVGKLLDSLTDDQLKTETATNRNTGVYLLGHLAAVSDGMLPILGLGDRLYPALDHIFLHNPEKAGLEQPAIAELKQYWKDINHKLSSGLQSLSTDDWFTRHTAVTEDDFAKEPHRNKLNIIVNRTNHTSYHLGQLVYLANKAG